MSEGSSETLVQSSDPLHVRTDDYLLPFRKTYAGLAREFDPGTVSVVLPCMSQVDAPFLTPNTV